jgi:hypothetical protein
MVPKGMKISAFFALLSFIMFSQPLQAQKNHREYYQVSIYHFENAEQEKMLDDYLQQALLPALHRMKLKNIGTFKPIANDTAKDKALYVLLPMKNIQMSIDLTAKLNEDEAYQQAGSSYINAAFKNPPYARMEIILLRAFANAPLLQTPALTAPKNERVYELRSYESATEKIHLNKVQMFNEGDEIGLFKRLNFNAVFYGQVIAGSKMPNLMYMTSFENMDARNAHWKTFSSDPQWKQLSSLPEYQNNVSHMDITFLRPTVYSDY